MFQYLFDRAMSGEQDVYFGEVPLELVDPFDPEFHPEETAIGARVVDATYERWTEGQFSFFWLYPRRGRYVASDDYVSLAAARRGQPDYIPAFLLAGPPLPGVNNVQGPLAVESLRRQMGFAE